MCINDICNVSQMSKFILFEDDTMFCCDNNINELVQLTNDELNKLHTWFAVNRLSLNVSKTNYMIFGNRSVKKHISLKVNNEEIDRVEVTTFVGVLIDAKLTWKNHISLVKFKLSKCCAIMYRANFVIGKHGMLILYNSLSLCLYVLC